ncbi:hypothetical protein [Cohnella nanjingensis]|uniref:TM2 domain-containing protein n=1 Tax=Cohnella nanjingensis TaxID=1387779 RepID=A0A7X0RSG1_9BACL|nr:hypothetical protein [Cohnella nanjingensis]MBB6672658.1 hypothetical protein [Cohnella nanjingensis]
MNESNEWQQQPPQSPPNPERGPNTEPPWGASGSVPLPPGYRHDYEMPQRSKRSKLLAGLFAFFIPGTGHMYLGLMAKGVVIMLFLALNICGVVFVANENSNNVLTIVLLSLLLPIIYFYNIFDAVQSAEAVNERIAAGPAYPYGPGWNGRANGRDADPRAVPALSIVLLAAGGAILLGMANIRWLFHSAGSMIGALILIGAGAVLWLWERRGHPGGKE